MKKVKREIKIGIFGVAMIGVAWAGIRFFKGFDIFSRNNGYYAAYDQINGVKSAAPIFIKGVKVGSVTGVSFDPTLNDKVILQFTINRKYCIPTNSEAKIFSDGLMGAKAIEIIYGSSERYLKSGDTLRASRNPDLMDVADSELDFFKRKFSQAVNDLSRTLNNFSLLIEENGNHISGTISNMDALTGNINSLVEQERENLHKTAFNFARFSEALGSNSCRVDSIFQNLNDFMIQLTEKKLVAKITTTVKRFNSLMAQIEEGDGTVSRLMNDSELYDSLTKASKNLSILLEDLKRYPGRYVHLSLFGRNPEKMKVKADKAAAKAAAKTKRDSLRFLKKKR